MYDEVIIVIIIILYIRCDLRCVHINVAEVKGYLKLSVLESRGFPFFQLTNLNPGPDLELVCRDLGFHLIEHLPCT